MMIRVYTAGVRLFICSALTAASARAETIAEDFSEDVLGETWQTLEEKGDKPGEAVWQQADTAVGGGVIHIKRGTLRSPLLPVAAETFYRVRARVRSEGTPSQRHRRPEGQAPHRGSVALRFYDAGGRVAPGSWFTQMVSEDGWHEVSLVALAPQWTKQLQVVVTAHPGCELEVDTVEFGVDADATAAFDGSAPVILYRPEQDRWQHLPRTMQALREGRPWRVVVLGDSIANDLYHSFFHRPVNALYPGADMQLVQSVAGSAGWHYFLAPGEEEGKEDRVKSFVLDHNPDLVLIAGMSSRNIEDLQELVRRIRTGTDAEIIAVSAAVCQAHYRDSMAPPPEGSVFPKTGRAPLRAAMAETAREMRFAFFDMGRTWDAFLWNEKRPLEWYTRDTSHLNPRGMAVVGRMMAGFFQPDGVAPEDAAVTIVHDEIVASPAAGEVEFAADGGDDAKQPTAEIVGRIVRVSPLLTISQIFPYNDAYRAVEYEVLDCVQGTMATGENVVVIQQTMKSRKPTPAAQFAADARHHLVLGLWEEFPDYENWPVSDTLDKLDARLYHAWHVRTAKGAQAEPKQ